MKQKKSCYNGPYYDENGDICTGGKAMERIFIVEDEEKIRSELKTVLEKNGYTVEAAAEFGDIPRQIMEAAPDLVLLDINLPVNDGFYICREIRRQSDIPVIVVTSSDSDMDELMSLNVGADDFITKPYNIHILLAHIGTVLHRVKGPGRSFVITHKGLSLDVLGSSAGHRGKKADLTKNELGILKYLMEHAGAVVSRNELICHMWEMEEFIEDSTLTVNVNRLRRKLSDIGLDDYLLTKRGQGYMV